MNARLMMIALAALVLAPWGVHRVAAPPTVTVPAGRTAPASTRPSGVGMPEEQMIADVLLVRLKQTYPQSAVTVSVTGIADDYAAALALPAGERTHYAFLQKVGGTWEVIVATSIPSSELLRQAGVPESLMQSTEASAAAEAWMAHLQDPRGAGVEGVVVVEALAGDYARVVFRPANLGAGEVFTAFLKREAGIWRQVTGGSAFDEETLRQLDIPEELWPVLQ